MNTFLDEIFHSCKKDAGKIKKVISKGIQEREQRKKDFKDVVSKKNEERDEHTINQSLSPSPSEDILRSSPVIKSEDGSYVRRFLRNGMERIRKFFTKRT